MSSLTLALSFLSGFGFGMVTAGVVAGFYFKNRLMSPMSQVETGSGDELEDMVEGMMGQIGQLSENPDMMSEDDDGTD